MIRFFITVSVLIGFFIVLWTLTYAFHNRTFKIMAWIVQGASILVFGASVFSTVLDVINPHSKYAFGRNLEGMSNTMGTFAFLWGLAAIFILFSKRLFRGLRNRRVRDGDVVRRILLLAKNHHNLFGWVTLIAATAHGIYFLFHAPSSWAEFYSGVGAWIALVLLATSGILMGKLPQNPIRAKFIRISHIALTAGYAAAIILHIRGSAVLAGLLFTAAFSAVILMWVVVRLTEMAKRRLK